MEETKLSSSVTIKQYRAFKAQKNTLRIADLILERFKERYVDPFENNSSKHGFSLMAIGCLIGIKGARFDLKKLVRESEPGPFNLIKVALKAV